MEVKERRRCNEAEASTLSGDWQIENDGNDENEWTSERRRNEKRRDIDDGDLWYTRTAKPARCGTLPGDHWSWGRDYIHSTTERDRENCQWSYTCPLCRCHLMIPGHADTIAYLHYASCVCTLFAYRIQTCYTHRITHLFALVGRTGLLHLSCSCQWISKQLIQANETKTKHAAASTTVIANDDDIKQWRLLVQWWRLHYHHASVSSSSSISSSISIHINSSVFHERITTSSSSTIIDSFLAF